MRRFELPRVLVATIFELLPYQELLLARRVSRYWYIHVKDHVQSLSAFRAMVPLLPAERVIQTLKAFPLLQSIDFRLVRECTSKRQFWSDFRRLTLPQLRALNFEGCWADKQAVKLLGKAPFLLNLVTLSFRWCRLLNASDVTHCLKRCPKLRRLDIFQTGGDGSTSSSAASSARDVASSSGGDSWGSLLCLCPQLEEVVFPAYLTHEEFARLPPDVRRLKVDQLSSSVCDPRLLPSREESAIEQYWQSYDTRAFLRNAPMVDKLRYFAGSVVRRVFFVEANQDPEFLEIDTTQFAFFTNRGWFHVTLQNDFDDGAPINQVVSLCTEMIVDPVGTVVRRASVAIGLGESQSDFIAVSGIEVPTFMIL